MPSTVTLYLEPDLRRSAEAGEHNFITRLKGVLRAEGFTVLIDSDSNAGSDVRTLAMTHMRPPPLGGLCFRRVYHYPFWAIESSAERWHWTVAKTRFLPETVPETQAVDFYRRWQKRLFADAPETARRDGFVYVPLQGRIHEQRSFQSCAPVEMLSQVLAAEPDRQVVATLHPRENYSDADLNALKALSKHPRLRIATGQMVQCLATCDYVVAMNSAVAFNAMFFGKPSILFGAADFHHITLKASPDDMSAFQKIGDHRPDFALYVYWFWQMMAINAGHPVAEDRIHDALLRSGWIK